MQAKPGESFRTMFASYFKSLDWLLYARVVHFYQAFDMVDRFA
jgi:hypothetical protein